MGNPDGVVQYSGCENAYQQMEELLFEVNEGMCINHFFNSA